MLHPIDKYCINDVTPLARRNITVAASAIILFSEEKDVKKYTKNEVVTYIIMLIVIIYNWCQRRSFYWQILLYKVKL